MNRTALAVVIASWLALPGAAYAQSTSTSGQAAAEALFDEGKKLMASGQYAQACAKLAESQRLDGGAGTLLNLASCYERLGQTATAWATYKETIAAADKSGRKEWAAAATKRVRAIEPTLSKLTISVAEAAKIPGLVIKRDGATIGEAEWGVPIPVDPGRHLIEASAPDKKAFSTTVELGTKADAKKVDVPALERGAAAVAVQPASPVDTTAPAKGSDPTPSPAIQASSGGGTMKIVGLGIAGVGLVGVGVGAIFGLKASSHADDAKPNCNADQSKCNPAGLGQVDDAKSAATISTIGFVAGAVLIAGGAALFLTAKSDKPSGRGTYVVPSFGNGGGLLLRSSF